MAGSERPTPWRLEVAFGTPTKVQPWSAAAYVLFLFFTARRPDRRIRDGAVTIERAARDQDEEEAAMSGYGRGRSVFEVMAEDYRRRLREAEELRRRAEAAASRAYHDAMRSGAGFAPRASRDLTRPGTRLAQPPAGRAVRSAAPNSARRAAADFAAAQSLAAARGAQDALTLGLGDRAYAGTRALMDAAHGSDLGDAWRRRMAAETARDIYDGKHYRTARTVGEVGGTALGLVALGPVDAALAGGVRIAQATAVGAREMAAISGAGAGYGVATQAVMDRVAGRRSSAGDYAGAALGGAVGALTSLRGRPTRAAALSGATMSVAQDNLNGRPADLREASRAARVGAYVAAPLGYAGRVVSDRLPSKQKGKLGEAMGVGRSLINGEIPYKFQNDFELEYIPKYRNRFRYTRVDHKTLSDLRTEQKFGKSHLTPNQLEALRVLGDRYRVDHFWPRDVGAVAAYPLAVTSANRVASDRRR